MISNLQIQTAVRGNITYLENAYFTTPLKIADITEDKRVNPLHLMLMSSSPGILDGDHYQLSIQLAEGSALQLHTQSYQRIFNMQQMATQQLEVTLSANSSFCYLPHPTVPHADAVFKISNKIYLHHNCSLVLGEIVTCGRKLNGEVFRFKKYHAVTEVFLQNKLVVKENLLIEPATSNLDAIGQMEGYTHQASLIYLHPTADMKLLSGMVLELLSEQPGIQFGVSPAPVNGLITRVLGQKAEQLHSCLQKIAGILPQQLIKKPLEYAS